MASNTPNFISIYDNTAEALLVYVSDSVTEVTGWTPEEIIGTPAYSVFHPDDVISITRIHAANVMNEKMSCMTRYRTKHKDGHYVIIETVVHYCFDVIMTTNFLYDASDVGHRIRCSSVDEMWVVEEDGSLHLEGALNDNQERLQQTLMTARNWINNRVVHPQEPRFSLIINRYTYEYTVVFASQMIDKLVGIPCDQILGKSLLDFVCESDRGLIETQLDMAKGTDMIMRMRFSWLMDHEKQLKEAVEAVVSSTNDGLAIVVRLAPRMSIR